MLLLSIRYFIQAGRTSCLVYLTILSTVLTVYACLFDPKQLWILPTVLRVFNMSPTVGRNLSSSPPMVQQPPSRPEPPHYLGLKITPRRTTFGRTPLDE